MSDTVEIKVVDKDGQTIKAFPITEQDEFGNWMARHALQDAFNFAIDGDCVHLPNGNLSTNEPIKVRSCACFKSIYTPRRTMLSKSIERINAK